MKRFTKDNWDALPDTHTGSGGKFVGVAIGPDSDAGFVRVNGHLLPSGQVLPLATESGYRIAQDYVRAGTVYRNPFLELYLFEHCSELACNVRRGAKHHILGAATGSQPVVTGVLSSIWDIPFENRRHARVCLRLGVGSVFTDWAVYGITRDGTSIQLGSASGLSSSSVSFHVGGTDHEEPWTALSISVAGVPGVIPTDNIYGECVVVGDL